MIKNNDFMKIKIGSDSDRDDYPIMTENDLLDANDLNKPCELLGGSNMDIQTARGPDAPDEAFLNEDSIE